MTLHPSFNEAEAALDTKRAYNLLRVDFHIKGFKDKLPDLSMFEWASILSSNQGKQNQGLKESIKQAILATKPEGRTIHTLFIRFVREK